MSVIIFQCVVIVALLLGGYIFAKPEQVIEIQKRLYRMVNWRMEPISMPKEIRNTRWMGLFLIVFTVASIIYYCLQ